MYYKHLPDLKDTLANKKVAVFGLGDQESYSENYADATGELFDVFTDLGCDMVPYAFTSQEGYEHDASKSIRGDKFCGLLLDMVNQEELTDERVEAWVAQLKAGGFLEGGNGESPTKTSPPAVVVEAEVVKVPQALEEHSQELDRTIESHASGGFTPHLNPVTGETMWTSPDGRSSYVTTASPSTSSATKLQP